MVLNGSFHERQKQTESETKELILIRLPLIPSKCVFQCWHRKNRHLYSAGLLGPPGQGVRVRGRVRMCRDPETTAAQHGPNPGTHAMVLLSVTL